MGIRTVFLAFFLFSSFFLLVLLYAYGVGEASVFGDLFFLKKNLIDQNVDMRLFLCQDGELQSVYTLKPLDPRLWSTPRVIYGAMGHNLLGTEI